MKTLAILFAIAALALLPACNRNGTTSSSEAATADSPAEAIAESETADEAPTIAQADVPTDDINPPPPGIPPRDETLELSSDEWRDRLTKKQFHILREAGTEYPGTGVYNKFEGDGTYHCSACNNPLFSSETKFDSKTGWPSFYTPVEEGRVAERTDSSMGMSRVEVLCEHCGGHLGHVFNDGPKPTGLRYCINSVSLYFRPDSQE